MPTADIRLRSLHLLFSLQLTYGRLSLVDTPSMPCCVAGVGIPGVFEAPGCRQQRDANTA